MGCPGFSSKTGKIMGALSPSGEAAAFVVFACAAQCSSFWHVRLSVRRFGVCGAAFVVFHVRLSVRRFGMCV